MPAVSAPPIPRVRALDGLRGLAVAAVVLFHAGHLTGGYLGVDVFFVLSGFLITTLLLQEHRTRHRIRLGSFWARRARRLLPALGLVLLAVAAWAASQPATELVGVRGDALATIGYVANWHAIGTGTDYWALFRSASPLEHTWSLAIEEQFYLVWPLALVALARRGARPLARKVLVVAIAGAAASWALMQLLLDPANTARAYYGTDTRAGSVLVGATLAALLALRPDGAGRRGERALGVAGVVGIVALGIACARLPGDDPLLYRAGFLACAIATIFVIGTAMLLPAHPLTRALAWRPLVALGLISYGVYLWHWPIDVVLDAERLDLTGWPLFAAQTAVTLTIATASYFLVEKPIRAGWGSTRFWMVATPAAAAVLVGVIVATTVGTPRGPALAGGAMATRDSLTLQQLALDRLVAPEVPRVLLTGDSLAYSLGANANADRRVPLGVANLGFLGCGITDGAPIGPRTASPESTCAQWPHAWRDALDVFSPRAVLLLSGVWDIWPRRVRGRTHDLYSDELTADITASLRRAHAIARRAGVPLVILTVPCLRPNGAAHERVGDGIGDPRRVRWLNRLYRDFARDTRGVVLVDLGPYACRLDRSAFIDGVHFSPSGAQEAWTWLAPRLLRIVGPPTPEPGSSG